MTSTSTNATGHLVLWMNGRLYDTAEEVKVSATDHGLVVGDGVFEALKVTEAGPFAVRRHLDRLARSARAIGLPEPDAEYIREGIDAVLVGREYSDGKIRITYTGGEGPLGSGAAYGPPSALVAADVSPPPPFETTIVTAPWSRNEHGALAGVKSTSYAENVRGLAFATDRGASEAIFLNTAGQVCEGTGTNIFYVFGDEVVTSPLSSGPLAGITRDLLLEWCDVTERDVTLTEAQAADEVFITSSLRDVQAVVGWDAITWPEAGPHTRRIAAVFAERSAANLEP